ncbi:MAG: mechanosensitive ion channel domain-containing protein [Cyanobacteria bacterium P01_A01_bin.84]
MNYMLIAQNIIPIEFDQETRKYLVTVLIRLGIFLLFVMLSLLAGRYTYAVFTMIVKLFLPEQFNTNYDKFITPLKNSFKITGTLILISVSLNWLKDYEGLYLFTKFFIYLAVTISIALLASRLFQQLLRIYGIPLVQNLGLEADDFVLVLETVVNLMIGFTAVIIFANTHNINLFALLTGVGIGGIAIVFAAQQVLEQLIGTIAIYLDRPYKPGEYIRVNFNPHAEDTYGRVESIGLRSTKIRIAARNTLLIVPNSVMVTKDIENITRGKKVMVLLYLDFARSLEIQEQALVEKIVIETTNTLFGIDPGSTKIAIFQPDDKPGNRARVTFFILGSSENSTRLRKRLLELANEKIYQQLSAYDIKFEVSEPSIYVDSPIPL